MSELRRWNLAVTKIRPELRTTVRAVITPDDDRGYINIRGADDEPGGTVQAAQLGETAVYSLLLTDAEAVRFGAAVDAEGARSDPPSNLLWIELDQPLAIPEPVGTGTEALDTAAVRIPSKSALRFMGADELDGWSGTGVRVAVLDCGVSTPALTAIACQRIAARNFSRTSLTDGITCEHGCWVASCAMTPDALLIDGVIADRDGRSSHAAGAAAMVWAVGEGAQVVNFSHGSTVGSLTMEDAVEFIGARGAVLVCAAGNDGGPLNHPAVYCTRYPHVLAAIAHDDATGQRPDWASHAAAPNAGAAPGVEVPAYGREGNVDRVSGSSFAAPLTVWMLIRLLTDGRWSPIEVVTALVRTARDTPEPPAEEGEGAWDLRAAIAHLEQDGPEPDVEPPPLPVGERRGCWAALQSFPNLLQTHREDTVTRRDRALIAAGVAALGAVAGVMTARSRRPRPLVDPDRLRRTRLDRMRKWLG